MSYLPLGFCALLFAAGCATDDNTTTMPGDDTAPPWTTGVSTLTGAAEKGFVDGERGVARFDDPVNVAYGPDGKLYAADFHNDKIRVIDVTTGATTTLIKLQNFKRPFGLAFGPDGVLWVSTDNNGTGGHGVMTGAIWRVDPGSNVPVLVVQQIGRPRGLAVLPDGRLVVCDYMHHVVEIVNPRTSQVSVLAGTWDKKGMVDAAGAAARFSTPYHVVVRPDGTLVVADFDNSRLRVVAMNGTVTTLSGAAGPGFGDGAMGDAKWNHPQGLAIAANGDLYVTDLGNFRVRRITATAVETIAGNGTGGYVDSDDKLAAELYGLEGMTLSSDGKKLYLADGGRGDDLPYNRIRVVNN